MNKTGDEGARRRFTTEFGTTFLVEAGAGTGKTTLLVARLLSMLASGAAHARMLVAVTFTERAAAELEIRIRQAVETAVVRGFDTLDAPLRMPLERLDPAMARANLEKALAGLDAAHIGTIHSFCMSMLAQRPLESLLDPGAATVDNDGMLSRFGDLFLREWLDALDAGNPDVEGLVRLGFGGAEAGSAAVKMLDQVDLLDSADFNPERFEYGDWKSRVEEAAGRLEDFIRRFAKADRSGRKGSTREDLEELLSSVRHAVAPASADDFEKLLGSGPGGAGREIRKPAKSFWEGGSERGEEAVRMGIGLESMFREARRLIAAPAFCAGLKWIRGRVFDIRGRLNREGMLGFSDLLLKARDLLRDDLEVRAYYQGRFGMILVDEFQDTDPLQAEIAFFLAEDGARASDWRKCKLKPGKLCIVADPKQSIYRFRRADVQTYMFVRDLITASGGETLAITGNFRSDPGIIRWVNGRFSTLMAVDDCAGAERANPPYADLAPARDETGEDRVFIFGGGVEAANKSDARKLEQAEIARIVKTAVSGDGLVIYDKRMRRVRRAGYPDIGILLPKRTDYAGIEEVLESEGIPFVSDVGQSFYARDEITDAIAVLEAVERPHDPVRLYAALHSPIFGFSDDDIASLKAETGVFSLFTPPERVPAAFRESFSLFLDLHNLRNRRPFAQTLRELFDRRRAWEFYGGQAGYGTRRAARHESLVAVAAHEDGEGVRSFERFVDRLSDLCEKGTSGQGELPLAFGGSDAVTLLTFHSAKGLEFPIVILANMCSSLAVEDGEKVSAIARRVPEPGFWIRAEAAKSSFHNRGFPEAESSEALLEHAEKTRHLYVACTRARDYLFISAVASKRDSGTYGSLLLGPGTPAAAGCPVRPGAPPAAPAPPAQELASLEAMLGERCAWIEAREKLIRDRNAKISVLRPSGSPTGEQAGQEIEKPGMPEDAAVGDSGLDFEGAAAGVPGVSQSAAFGSAFHRLMAAIDLNEARSTASIESFAVSKRGLAEAIAAGENLDSSSIPDLMEALSNTLRSDPFRRALAADSALREVPMFYSRDDGSLVQGVADLAFLEGGRWTVVDFKTDRIRRGGETSQAGKYGNQLRLYAEGLRKWAGESSTVSCIVLFARTGVAIEVGCGTETGSPEP